MDDLTADELYRLLFAAQAGGMDVGGIERTTFNNAKDFEKMLTGIVAQSRPGSFDPAAFQDIVTGYEEVVLPQRTLFNQVMLSDGPDSPERDIAEMLEDGLTPMAFEQQALAERGAGPDSELDKDQYDQAVADVGKMVAFAERLYSEKMDYDKAVGQLSPDVAQYAAANPGAGLYRKEVREESPAAKFYTERGLPTPDEQWSIDDLSPGYGQRQAERDDYDRLFQEFKALTRDNTAAARGRNGALEKGLREQSWDSYSEAKASEAKAGSPAVGTAAGQRAAPASRTLTGTYHWGDAGKAANWLQDTAGGLKDWLTADAEQASDPYRDASGGEMVDVGQEAPSSSRAVKAVPSASGMWRQAQANHDAKNFNERFTASMPDNSDFKKAFQQSQANYWDNRLETAKAERELARRNREGLTPLTAAMRAAIGR